MTTDSIILPAFSAGEWDMHLYGRTDIDQYASACREMTNFIALPQGPAVRRPGTRYIANAKNNDQVRLLPFEFSTEQAYIIEAGANYFRFYKDRGQIQNGALPVEIATPYSATDLGELTWAQSADVLYLVHPKYAPRKLSRQSHTSWTLTVLDPRDGPYLEQNGTATTLIPAAASGTNILLTASASLFLATDVGRLVRLRHGSVWGWGKIIAVTNDKQARIDIKGNFGGTTAVTLWRLGAWSDTTGWPGCVTFQQDRLFFARTKTQPQTIWGSVAADYERFSPTEYDGTVIDSTGLQFTISDDRVNAIWWMSAGRNMILGTSGGAFIMETSNDGPITPSNASVRRDTTKGSAPIAPILADRALIYIQRAGRKLHHVSFSNEGGGLVTRDLSAFATHLANIGLRQIVYQQVPWSILWIVGANGHLLGVTYDPDKEVIAWHRHLLAGADAKVVSAMVIPNAVQDEIWLLVRRTINGASVLYLEVMENDYLPSDDYDTANAVFLDATISFDGTNTTDLRIDPINANLVRLSTSASLFKASHLGREVHHRYVLPDGGYEVAKAEITRFIDANTVEARIKVPFPAPMIGSWAIAATKIGGLQHLIGEKVSVLADGAAHPDSIVSAAGEITLSRPVAKAQIGLLYQSRLVTMDIDAGILSGTAQGRNKRIASLVLRFKQSLGCLAGGLNGPLERLIFRDGLARMDQAPPLFSGDRVVPLPNSWAKQAAITIVQDQPLPCTIVALIPQITTMDG